MTDVHCVPRYKSLLDVPQKVLNIETIYITAGGSAVAEGPRDAPGQFKCKGGLQPLLQQKYEWNFLFTTRQEKQVCVQPRSSAVSTTLPAFTAVRRAPALAIDQYLLPAGRSAANPPHAAAVDRWDRQTDRRTDASPCSTKTAKRRITKTTSHDSPETLVF